jgi:AraC-like DNA-binding protein
MREARSIDAYLAAPVGAFVQGSHFLCGSVTAEVYVAFIWGRPDGRAMAQAVRALSAETRPGAQRHVTYFDCTALTGVDRDAFGILLKFWKAAAPRQALLLRKQALVRPGGLAGTFVAGFFRVFNPPYPARTFQDPVRAYRWLGVEAEHSAQWRRARDSAMAAAPEVQALRKLFTGGPFPTIDRAAHLLGLGARTLQRRLAAASTDFQTERDSARFDAARTLLMESALKLSAIATDLGFSAPQHFSDWFKKRSGVSPSEFRRRQQR